MKKLSNWIINLIFVLSLAIALFFILARFVPQFGYNIFAVRSGSMEPAIKKWDLIITQKQDHYQTEDIITFRRDHKTVITHRIIEVQKEGGQCDFITKGDANQDPDRKDVPERRVLGKMVTRIPWIGISFNYRRQLLAGAALLAVIAAGFYLSNIKKNFDNSKPKSRVDKSNQTKPKDSPAPNPEQSKSQVNQNPENRPGPFA